ncbi:response regulator [Halocella sp. SP3-1]|uniref:response regulator transcription factor n=1 Tax=Halocella sp. SP3-1 TaxID=2382161 RepID=UPI000F7650AC|nr:response regulator [Halocella sp. SP3-1]AZO94348.1 response regulator [Halocella sp. SP3-1]
MYKALLIDDEPWILKDLELLVDWNKFGFEVIAKISNSREAVQLIKKQQPDLIVCDIKMPGLNGLELMKMVKVDFPGIYVVFVSAYSEFAYAKEAIELGAFDYILKPTKDKELKDVLNRVSSRLDKDSEEKKELEKYRKTELFLELLENELEEDEIVKKLNNIGYDVFFESYCILIVNLLGNDAINEQWQSQLQNCFSSYKLLFIQLGGKKWLILFNFSLADLRDSRCFEKLGLIADKYKLSIGISDSFDNLIDLKHHYKEAELLSYNHFIYKKGGIYKHSLYNNNYIGLSTKIKGLTSCGDLERFVAKLPKLLNEKRINLEEVAYLYNQLQEKSNTLCNLSEEIELLDPVDIIYLFNDLHGLFAQLRDILNKHEDGGKSGVSHNIIGDIVKEIKENFHKDLRLQDLALKYHVNYNYLSQLFKKETGQTFTNYLIEFRIKKAIRLFSKDLLFYEIARRVGYKDYYHFCKIFKKHKGLSPSEFKKKNV